MSTFTNVNKLKLLSITMVAAAMAFAILRPVGSSAVTAPEYLDLGQPLSSNVPVFPGDPAFKWETANCVNAHPELGPQCTEASGYLVEKITELGTHNGTHISAPCHFHEDKVCLQDLDIKFFVPRPLVVINVKSKIQERGGNGNFYVTVKDLQAWELKNGRIPNGAYVVVYTGLSQFYALGNKTNSGQYNDYFDSAPGFSAESTKWLFDQRGTLGLGSDTFGPDATQDGNYGATTTILGLGGITIENLGTKLASMPVTGSTISLNGPKYTLTPGEKHPGQMGFSGTQVGVTGTITR